MGKHTDMVQWDTMRRMPTWYTNSFDASKEYGGGAIYSSNEKKVYELTAPTTSHWFP